MTWLTGLFTDGSTAPAAWGLLILLIALGGTIGYFQLRRSRSGLFMSAGRHRRPRLAVMDATAVDNRRKLVLVRRDGVEHLILIGGTSDLVVERNIDASIAAAEAEAAQAKRQERGRSRRQAAPKPQVQSAQVPQPQQITAETVAEPAKPAQPTKPPKPTPAPTANGVAAAPQPTKGPAKDAESVAPAAVAGAALAASAIAPAAPSLGGQAAAAPETPDASGDAMDQAAAPIAGAPDTTSVATEVASLAPAAEIEPAAPEEIRHALGIGVASPATSVDPETDNAATIEAATDALTEMLNAEAPLDDAWREADGATHSAPDVAQDRPPFAETADIAPATPEDTVPEPASEIGQDEMRGESEDRPTAEATATPHHAMPPQPPRREPAAAEPTQPHDPAPVTPPGMGRPEPHTAAAQPVDPKPGDRPAETATVTDPASAVEEQAAASNVTPLARFVAPKTTDAPSAPAAGNSDTPAASAPTAPAPAPAPADNNELDEAAQSQIEAGQPGQEAASTENADDLKSEMERLLDQLVNATRAHK